MVGVVVKLTQEEVKLLKANGYQYEAECNNQTVSKKTAKMIRETVDRLKIKENGNVFHA